MAEVKIHFEAVGSAVDKHKVVRNMLKNYPEFDGCIDPHVPDFDGVKEFKINFVGEWDGSIWELARLTHHAEGLYEGTRCEYVHVEVEFEID